MNKVTLVSLVSQQPLPNALFIKALRNEANRFLFLVTNETERDQMTETLMHACQLEPGVCERIKVDPESYQNVLSVLNTTIQEADARYIVNITGGTKMMAMAAKDFFATFGQSEIFYIPIGHNQAFSINHTAKQLDLPELSLEEYLNVHAYTCSPPVYPARPHEMADALFEEVIAKGHAGKVSDIMLRLLPGYDGDDKNWYMGDWMEEWLYVKLKEVLLLEDGQIRMNAKLRHFHSGNVSGNDNEVDVLFVKGNKLYMIEAKVYTSEHVNASKIIIPLYKMASLQTTLGLHAQSIVVIMAPLWSDWGRRSRIDHLKRVLRINSVWDMHDMVDYAKMLRSL